MVEYKKYSGAGNDFLMVNNLKNELSDLSSLTKELVAKEEKKFDGVIYLEDSDIADFRMNYYNRDGTGNALCGNGLRCTARYIKDNSFSDKDVLKLEAVGKIFQAEFLSDGDISVSFPSPKEMRFGFPLKVNFSEWWQDIIVSYVDLGSKHCVIFTDDIKGAVPMLENIDVNEWGRNIRMHTDFMPEGVNANFAEIRGEEIYLRSFEKGVEGETLACGTGALSTGLAAYALKNIEPPFRIKVRSGATLRVNFKIYNSRIMNLTLTGPASEL
jgi:diaminopimelate epimerase